MGHPQCATWAKSREIKHALGLTTPTLQGAYCHLSRAATDPRPTRGRAGLCCPAFYFHSLPFPHSEHVAPKVLHHPTNDDDREVGGYMPAPAAVEGRATLARGCPRCTLEMLQPQAPASTPCLAESRPHSLLMSPVAAMGWAGGLLGNTVGALDREQTVKGQPHAKVPVPVCGRLTALHLGPPAWLRRKQHILQRELCIWSTAQPEAERHRHRQAGAQRGRQKHGRGRRAAAREAPAPERARRAQLHGPLALRPRARSVTLLRLRLSSVKLRATSAPMSRRCHERVRK